MARYTILVRVLSHAHTVVLWGGRSVSVWAKGYGRTPRYQGALH